MGNIADSLTECNLSAMSQQTTTVTKQVSVMPLYMHGTCLDLYRDPFIPRGPRYFGSTVYLKLTALY